MFEVEVVREQPEKMSRLERLGQKFKGTLLCEWCNRHTEVKAPQNPKKNKLSWSDYSLEEWLEFKETFVWFVCDRPTCKQGRPNDLVTKTTPKYDKILNSLEDD